MTNRNKNLGSQFERDCVKYFNDHGYPHVERRYGAGNTVDKGDLNGFAHEVVIECKNLKAITLSTIADETAREKANAGAKVGVAIIKRKGRSAKDAYCMVSFDDLIYLLREAGF